jgi:hypothetical protein
MILIGKPPALQIVCVSLIIPIAIVFCSAALKPSEAVGGLVAAFAILVYGGSVVGADLRHRRDEGLSAFSLAQSTLFFLIPTWVVGVPIALAGALGTVVMLFNVLFRG